VYFVELFVDSSPTVTEVVGVFVRFRAPLQSYIWPCCGSDIVTWMF
jgi:hypothetical protein